MSNLSAAASSPTVPQPCEDGIEQAIAGFKGTPEEIEKQWLEKVYRGRGDSMKQLTLRAVLMGMVLGGILSSTNIYIGLKAGWCFGVTITACILSFSIWNLFLKLRIARTPMTILENNCMQSTSSAAGYSTGTTLISSFSAYLMINGTTLPMWQLFAWIFFLAVLGITMAIPMKRQMLNVEQLRFPTGTATAETLRALYSHGEKAARAARALTFGGLVAAGCQFWTDGLKLISTKFEPYMLGALLQKLSTKILGVAWMDRTVVLSWDCVFIAAGALSGLRVMASMLLGGTLCWCVFVPILQEKGIVTGRGFREIVPWTLWGGVACMVTSGLLMFFMQWQAIARAFQGLGSLFGRKQAVSDRMESLEAPMSWFLWGQIVGFLALAWLAHLGFNMPYWQSAVAVVLSFFLALVASRVTGETDTTPIGPMGKVTQLTFGALSPGNTNVNLMSATITSSSAIAAADLLTDLKSGYLLGANPRKQFVAQFAGIFVGTAATVLCWRALVPNADVLGTAQFPAPAAQTWRAVALAMSKGLGALEPVKVWSMVVGGVVGIALPLLGQFFPKRRNWIPSAAAFGLAWTCSWDQSFLFFLGGLGGWIFEKKRPKLAEEFNFPIASGMIAGGSLMAVTLIFWENGGKMFPQLWKALISGQ